MKTCNLPFFFFLLIPITGTLAQSTEPSLSLRARVQRGLQQSDLQSFLDASKKGPAEALDVGSAIIAAGNTHDRFWIPHLKPFLKNWNDPNSNLSDLATTAQAALAKLGEAQQLQEIACEANFGSNTIEYSAVNNKLNYVQGWFSINILATWLDETYQYKPILIDRRSHSTYLRPQDLALKFLPQIVSDPPPFSSEQNLYEWMSRRDDQKLVPVRREWQEWIRQNETTLRKLQPAGEGIDSSEATCKKVLTHDHHIDRSG